MFFVLILVIGLYAIYKWDQEQHKKTDYYQQTHTSHLNILTDKGKIGEYLTGKYLRNLSGYKKFLFNCYIPKGNGETAEIDVILLHESGIYVFESKNYSGWIFGTETQRYWTQTLAAGRGTSQKEYFFNPIMQNEGHLKWLSKYLGKEQIPLYSYIVFSERCTLKGITLTSGRHHVIKRNDLLSAVSANAQMRPGMLTADEIDSIYLKLLPLTQVSETQKADHITNIYTKTTPRAGEKKQNTANAPGICPYCGGALKLRTAKRGAHFGEHFWGCSNYPRCRYMKKI